MSAQTDRIERKLDEVLGWARWVFSDLQRVLRHGRLTMSKLDDVAVKLDRMIDVGDGMATLLGTLAQEIRDNRTDPAKLDEIATKIDTNTQEWIDATLANTPAAPPAPPEA